MDQMKHGLNDPRASGALGARQAKLSYKFQRLRERLRQAVTNGELTGKLPGERQLARKFRVNAKTLSKALTDLAAEGLLDRSIGRGTFVRGAETPAAATSERWLIICDPGNTISPIAGVLMQANPNSQIITETDSLRPSFINQFKAIINLSASTPESFLRDLVVRNMTVVLVDREPEAFSMHAVVFDRVLAASRVARQMILAGHSRFIAVEAQGQHQIADAVRATAARLGMDVTVEPAHPQEIAAALHEGATAIICDCSASGSSAMTTIQQLGSSLSNQVSVASIDSSNTALGTSGYCLDPDQQADAVLQILRDQKSRRPMTLWLAGSFQDHGTMNGLRTVNQESPARLTMRHMTA